ncbi:hypothetical protein SISNIDRAFT_402285, partial [Sistotremastrum niveocremeum HHB9708]
KWDMPKARGQGHTVESIHPYINAIHERYPTQGARYTQAVLRQEYGVMVSTEKVAEHNRQHEAEAVDDRRRHAYIRHVYITPAVGECWSFDQHDKMADLKIYFHVCIEVFSGRPMWSKVWRSNRNPRLICSYYLDTIEELGFMPALTQSDRGNENHGIANAQTELRHNQQPSLGRTLQHRWRGKNRNIKPEQFWSFMRRGWAPGKERVVRLGVAAGYYDVTLLWERGVFHFIFIPWLQRELDSYIRLVRFSKRRQDKNVDRPRDEPEFIFRNPAKYGVEDWHIPIAPEDLQEARQLYANPNHPVFQLVEPDFGKLIQECYERIGTPQVDIRTCWDVYNELKKAILETVEGDRKQ